MPERRAEYETLPAAPDSAVERAPELPDHYAAAVKVASGGMGDVYRVRDTRLDRDVMMKRLRTSTGESGASRAAFVREATLQAALGHPGIVSVFELGEDRSGLPFFTMQEVQGTTLAEAIDRPPTYPAPAPWSRRALLEVLARVALTVAFAHEKEVLHLDLKPENIMLGHFGEVYVLDWGIARSTASDGAAPELVGTPQYMAPEQAEAVVAPDARADVFALGAILFEILTTEMLRRAPSTWAALQAAREDANVSGRLAEARVPLELAALCVRATAHDRADRLPSARAFNEALERWLDGERDVGARQQAAQRALDRALDARRDQEPRAHVMRHLARAVAIDPTCEPAITALADLMLESSKTVPSSAARELEEDALKSGKRAALAGVITYAAWFSLLPIALVIGVRSFSALALIVAPAFVTAVQSAIAFRRGWSVGSSRRSS